MDNPPTCMACSHLYVFVHLYAHLANLGNVIKLVQATICTLGTSTTSKVVNAWPATKAPLMANTANTGGSFCLWAACILCDLGWFPLLSHVGHIPLSHLLREFADIVLKFWCSDVLCIIGQDLGNPTQHNQLPLPSLISCKDWRSWTQTYLFLFLPYKFCLKWIQMDTSCWILPFIPRLPILNLFCCQWNCQGWKALRSFQLFGWFQLNGVNKGRAVRQLKSHGSLPEGIKRAMSAVDFFKNLIFCAMDETSKNTETFFFWNREYGFVQFSFETNTCNLKWRSNSWFHTASATTPERREFGEFRAKVLPKPSLTQPYHAKFDTYTHGPAQIFRKSWRNKTISAMHIYIYIYFLLFCLYSHSTKYDISNMKISFNTFMNDINFTTSSWKCL